MTTSWSETIVVAWIVYILVESPRGAALVFGALSALVFVGAFRLACHERCVNTAGDGWRFDIYRAATVATTWLMAFSIIAAAVPRVLQADQAVFNLWVCEAAGWVFFVCARLRYIHGRSHPFTRGE